MPKEKGPEWNYVTVLADGGDKGLAYATMECLFCDKTYNGGPKRIRAHLIGGDSCILKCEKVPNDVINAVKALEEQTKKVAQDKKKRKIELDKLTKSTESASQKAPKQVSIAASFNSGFKAAADAAVARMFYSTGIPFSLIESQYCKEAFSAVAKCGPSYKLPTRKALSGNLLQNAVASVDDKLAEFKTQMASTGATLVSDGWTNVQNRPIINFLAVTADGAMFIDGTDTSGEQKDAQYIAAEIKRHIQQLGAENIVQVVTDSADNCAAARSVLTDDFPTITFSPCSAHCLDLLLEDIGNFHGLRISFAKGTQS